MLVMKVLIDKAKRSNYWYRGLIGTVVEVSEAVTKIDGVDKYLLADISPIRWVLKEDCTIQNGKPYEKKFKQRTKLEKTY